MNTVHIVCRSALALGMTLVSVPAFAQAQGGSGAGGTMGSISTPAGHSTGDEGTDHTSGTSSSKSKSKKRSDNKKAGSTDSNANP